MKAKRKQSRQIEKEGEKEGGLKGKRFLLALNSETQRRTLEE